MKKKIFLAVLVLSLLANIVLSVLIFQNDIKRSEIEQAFYQSAELARGYFWSHKNQDLANGYSDGMYLKYAISYLQVMEQMQRLLNKTENDKFKEDQLRILIEMLVVTPETFNNSIDEIINIMEILKKDYSDINAYKRIDGLITTLDLKG